MSANSGLSQFASGSEWAAQSSERVQPQAEVRVDYGRDRCDDEQRQDGNSGDRLPWPIDPTKKAVITHPPPSASMPDTFNA
jgi:hypothetical protein